MAPVLVIAQTMIVGTIAGALPAEAAGQPALSLSLGADSASVTAGNPIGFTTTVTNRPTGVPGRIVIETRVQPHNAGGTFAFSRDLGSFSLSGSDVHTSDLLDAGTYAVTMAAPAAETRFRLIHLSCDESPSVTDLTTLTASIHLDPGELVRCVFVLTREARGRIVIETRVQPHNAGGTFAFSRDLGSFSLSGSDVHTSDLLDAGTYAVTMAAPAADTHFRLSHLSCDESPSVTDPATLTATIHLDPGELVRCVFVLTRETQGKIVIETRVQPHNAVGTFAFSGELGDFSLSGSDEHTSELLFAGTYTVSATVVPTGFTATSISCDDALSAHASSTDIAVRSAVVNLDPGELVRCVWTLTSDQTEADVSTVIFENQLSPLATGPTSNSLVVGFEPVLFCVDSIHTSIQLVSGSQFSCRTVEPRIIAVANTGLVRLSCDDGASAVPSTVDPGTGRATLNLEPGETVRCLWLTTTQESTVILENQLSPLATGPMSNSLVVGFEPILFCVDSVHTSMQLASGTQFRCPTVEPTVTAIALTGLSNAAVLRLSCDDGQSGVPSTVDQTTGRATIRLEPGETVRCLWLTTTQESTVILENQLSPLATGPTSNSLVVGFEPILFCVDSVHTSMQLASGTQFQCRTVEPTVTAIALTGLSNAAVLRLSCDDGQSGVPSTVDQTTGRATIRLEPGETVRCVWLTTTLGEVGAAHNVTFTDVLPTGAGISWSVAEPVSGCSIASNVLTCGLGNLAPGVSVAVHVTSPTSVASCGSYTNTASAQADDAALVRGVVSLNVVGCTGSASAHKTVSGAAPVGQQTFTFQLRQGASTTQAGTIIETGFANAGDGGIIHFATAIVAGTTFALCEIVMPGWKSTLGPSAYAVFNASGDNSTLCADFSLSPGQALTIVIDNTPPPGGLALTIGFWKNWASCSSSNGKQRPVLDQTLAAADPAGIPVGLLTFHSLDCVKAVRILNKSTIDNGTKMSSDAAFNLAAQLLAAKLDGVAGARTCVLATTAISDAQALLASMHFAGITHDKLTKQQIAKANELATTLDAYNNNRLC